MYLFLLARILNSSIEYFRVVLQFYEEHWQPVFEWPREQQELLEQENDNPQDHTNI
jgi:hypothetical protein